MGMRGWIYKAMAGQKHQHVSKWNLFHVNCSVNSRNINPRTSNFFQKKKSWRSWGRKCVKCGNVWKDPSVVAKSAAQLILQRAVSFFVSLSIDKKLPLASIQTCTAMIPPHITAGQWSNNNFFLTEPKHYFQSIPVWIYTQSTIT